MTLDMDEFPGCESEIVSKNWCDGTNNEHVLQQEYKKKDILDTVV
jgi:hypothetical protein